VVQHAPRSLPVRLAALLHDLAKPLDDNGDHAKRGAEIADAVLERLRYPTRLRRHVVALVAGHAFHLDDVGELFVRRFLREHGADLALDLVVHKDADLRSKNVPEPELAAVIRMRALLGEQASHPHRVSDLAVDGSDLIEVGYSEGPELGDALERLLDLVVEDPARNDRERLLEQARSWLK
jgi:tRNA nucleotidyltransferase (CCA-adding enzyme)